MEKQLGSCASMWMFSRKKRSQSKQKSVSQATALSSRKREVNVIELLLVSGFPLPLGFTQYYLRGLNTVGLSTTSSFTECCSKTKTTSLLSATESLSYRSPYNHPEEDSYGVLGRERRAVC